MADLIPATNVFEKLKRVNEHGSETWSARELARVLEYSEFRHFQPVIAKAREVCEKSGHQIQDHFEEILDMVEIGSGAQRQAGNWQLSRYACYLVIQNADPSKPLVALGQSYFAVQPPRQELTDADVVKTGDKKEMNHGCGTAHGITWESAGGSVEDHFRDFTKMVPFGCEPVEPSKTTRGPARNTIKILNMSSFSVIQQQMTRHSHIRPPQIPEGLSVNSRGCREERAKPPVLRPQRINPGWGWPMVRARRAGMGQPRRGWINGRVGPGGETPGYSWENHSVVGEARTILVDLKP